VLQGRRALVLGEVVGLDRRDVQVAMKVAAQPASYTTWTASSRLSQISDPTKVASVTRVAAGRIRRTRRA